MSGDHGLLVESLRDAQAERCAYGTREGDGRTCDCKSGAAHFGVRGEMTGCVELRAAIWVLTNSAYFPAPTEAATSEEGR